jgi:hypothetical protein
MELTSLGMRFGSLSSKRERSISLTKKKLGLFSPTRSRRLLTLGLKPLS